MPADKRIAAHALLWGGLAAMFGGIYLLAGTGWSLVLGGFIVYAVGSDLLRKHHEREAVKAVLAAHERVCASSPFPTLHGGQTAGEAFNAAVAAAVKKMKMRN